MAVVLGAGDVEVDLPRLAVELAEALRAGPAGAAGLVGPEGSAGPVGAAGAAAAAAAAGAAGSAAAAGLAGAAGPAQRVRVPVTPDVTAMILLPGLAPGIPAYTVKVHAKNPNRSPAITGVICLHDLETGDLLALIDSAGLTALRTGLGGALGAHVLARPDARTVTVIGAGAQGRAQLQALAALRPIESVTVRDTNPTAAAEFVAWAEGLRIAASVAAGPGKVDGASGIGDGAADGDDARAVGDGAAARSTRHDTAAPSTGHDTTTRNTRHDTTARNTGHGAAARSVGASVARSGGSEAAANNLGEIVLMATWSREPVLHQVPAGTHVTSLGADEPGKVELAPGLLAGALVVVDDPGLAHVAADTTIGAVLRGEHPGRTSAEQVTVYSPAGLPMQDLVIAWHVYRNACRKSPAVFDVGLSRR